MIYTNVIRNFSGYELSQEFDTSTTGAKEEVVLSGNNNGAIIGVKTYEYTPAVKEKLTEVYSLSGGEAATPTVWATEILTVIGSGDVYLLDSIQQQSPTAAAILGTDTPAEAAAKIRALTLTGVTVSGEGAQVIITSNTAGSPVGFPVIGRIDGEPGAVPGILTFTGLDTLTWGTDEGGARKENASYLFQDATVVGGDVLMYFNSASPVTVAIGSGDSVAQAIDKLVAAVPTGWTGENLIDMLFNITAEVAEAKSIRVNIDWNGAITSVADDISPILGVDSTGGGELVPGDIDIYFNSATPVIVTAEEGDEVADIYAKIIASAPDGYTITSSSNIVIECDTAGAQAIPLSIDLGDTGITVDSTTLVSGADEIIDEAESVSVKTQYTIDSRARIDAGTAIWKDADTIAAGVYTEKVFTHPVSAVRVNCLTSEATSVARLIVRSAE